jgi:hypothetical protein
MTRLTALSKVGSYDLPKELAGAQGYARTFNNEQAKLDVPLATEAKNYRKLMPNGDIVIASGKWTKRQADAQGYVETKGEEATIEHINTIRATEERVKDAAEIGMAIFKAEPGILQKGKQLGELALSRFTNAGKKINYYKDGKQLTLGEAVNLYNSRTKQMLEAVARGVNAVKGAGTEGDVQRQMEGFAGGADTATVAKAKFDGLLKAFSNSRLAYYRTVFGEEAADQVENTRKASSKASSVDEKLDRLLQQLEGKK